MLEKIRKQENIWIFTIILLISILICFCFLKFHTVPDTYNILEQKYEYCKTFLNDGRLISALYLLLGKSFHISIVTLKIISNILSVIFQSICVYIIYKAIRKKENNHISNCILLIGAYLMVFHPLAIAHLGYLECGIMCLGKLACTMAAKLLIKDEKVLSPMLLIMLAAICYQGILNVFIAIGLLLLILQENQTVKQKMKKILQMGVLCVIALITIIVALKIGSNILGQAQNKTLISGNEILNSIILVVKLSIQSIFIDTWNLFPQYLFTIVIIITSLLFIVYKKPTDMLIYWTIIILITLSCIIPLALTNVIPEARTVSSIGTILGISIIMLENLTKQNRKKEIVILIFAILIFCYNAFIYINNGIMLQESNKSEKEYINDIITEITKYEQENEKEITKVAIYIDRNSQRTSHNYPNNYMTAKTIHTVYANIDFINYYLGRKLEQIDRNEEISQYFWNKEWENFEKEQLIFIEDELHLCIF